MIGRATTGLARRIVGFARQLQEGYRAPHGVDFLSDLRRETHGRQLSVIFDVGANVGQSSLRYQRAFPCAHLYSFEPIRHTYDRLEQSLRDRPMVHCYNQAMGAAPGEIEVVLQKLSIENSLLQTAGSNSAGSTEWVRVDTVDRFCQAHNIPAIDFLKIDTEGFDLEVLKGAETLLAEQRVAFVQVEAGIGAHNTKHVPLQVLQQHLQQRHYVPFGFYEQTPEFWNDMPRLRFCNVVFIAEREVEAVHQRLRSNAASRKH